ncbi:MAG: tetratricopeptide repeat protein [Symploca sp. SIO1C4]|uniref:Tetratricopeptide repeat protein n=1 Tax=Symploca sp. SIO1C4 TaxID=2607765 RepID=A0A6B3N8H7_9CYAN|nr:tetratricopeptide repeat protein [Symploca sp. SIO1C4]
MLTRLINFARQLVKAVGLSSASPTSSRLPTADSQLNFLMDVLKATYKSNGKAEVVYPLLQANLDQLDDNLALLLRDWARATLAEVEPKLTRSIAVDIVNFSNRIQEFPLGSRATNLEIAITGYELVGTVFTREAFPQDWAMTQNNLASAYLYRIRGDKADNLESAIAACQAALQVRTREAFPQNWATTQNNLANAYLYRIRGDKADNLESAIAACQAALQVRTREAFPQNWATTQNNLANAYLYRIRGDKADNLESAIAACQAALQVRTREAFPQNWATTQNNLANAYLYRIRGDKADNLENAIAACQAALQVRTREAFPQDWAMTQNNLANAYRNRIRGDKADNLENAIAACQAALQVRTREAFPQDWATTQNNLAIAYLYRIRGDKADNLENAIAACQAALQVYTREAFPQDWAMTQNNLAIAYLYRIRGDKADNLESAIAAYQDALQVYTREAFPQQWAMTQNNLATAYCDRIRGDKADNLEKAIAACQAALQVRTREAFPQSHAGTLFNLGLAYQDAQQFTNAYHTFAKAIETVELLRGEIVLGSGVEEDKQKLAEEYNRIYSNMVAVCLELNYRDQAIEYIERSKTRNLIELFATRDLYPQAEIAEAARKQLQQLRQEIEDEQRRLKQEKEPNYSQINQLRQQYNQLYPYQPIRFAEIQNHLDEDSAIIEWYIFNDCFRALIITPQEEQKDKGQPSVWTSSTQDYENLQNWAKDYLQAYDATQSTETEAEQKELQKQWETSIASRLQQLAEILHLDDILDSYIPETCKQLILVPHLYLHLFPIHALEVRKRDSTDRICLLDYFPKGVRYLPSCQLLPRLQQQQRPVFKNLFAIQNPTLDLYEQDLGAVSVIKKQFTDTHILKEDKAKKSAILCREENGDKITLSESLLRANCLFFFCHGYFNWASPLDSGLQLADENLTLADIITHFNLKNCRLVTLSACETGISELSISDEYISLPYGFLLAGSTNVVSSLWAVNATATALLMIEFYQQLQQQNNIAVALKNAQCWLRDTTAQGFQDWLEQSQLNIVWKTQLGKYFQSIAAEEGETHQPFENPYYWAAFCAIGKGV